MEGREAGKGGGQGGREAGRQEGREAGRQGGREAGRRVAGHEGEGVPFVRAWGIWARSCHIAKASGLPPRRDILAVVRCRASSLRPAFGRCTPCGSEV